MNPPAAVTAPAGLTALAARVTHCIAEALDNDIARWVALDPDLSAPLDALRTLALDGGKRLRPAFCFWGFVGAGGDPEDPAVIRAGAALEMLHVCALIHDDVLDGSQRRRGHDTIHVDFARRHREAAWRGDSDRFGVGAAVLMGDQAFVYSDRFLAGAHPAARGVFDEVRLEVHVGQYLDLLGAARGNATVAQAERICRYKTAKYTVERPLHLGAALLGTGSLAALAQPLSDFGLPLGEAFQLTDDLLGVFGDPEVTGKPVGDDLREGKPTRLYALAREAASGADRAFLDDRYGAADLDSGEVTALQQLLENTGARARTVDAVDELLQQSLDAAEALPVTSDARQALVDLAHFATGRQY